MIQDTLATLAAVGLFAGLLAFGELGYRLGLRRAAPTAGGPGGTGLLEGALLGLLGLLLAFSFAGAAERYEARRQLIVGEASAIRTAWLRLDLLPGGVQGQTRDMFRQYLELRIETFRALPDEAASKENFDLAQELQGRIWGVAIATVGANPGAVQLVLGSLNEMFEFSARRAAALRTHPPLPVYVLLFALAFTSALFSGFALAAGGARRPLHSALFAGLVAAAVFVILDLEYPRQGLIRVDGFDQVLVDVRREMK